MEKRKLPPTAEEEGAAEAAAGTGVAAGASGSIVDMSEDMSERKRGKQPVCRSAGCHLTHVATL